MTIGHPNGRSIDTPRISVAELQRLAGAQLSLSSRVGYVLLLLVSLTMAVAIGSLWATEPSLPLRTQVAFGAIVAVALAWVTFATWVLTRRRVLLGTDRVLAAKMGIAFSALGVVGMLAGGYWSGMGSGAYLGALLQSVLCAAAAALLVRARKRVDDLSRRRRELDGQLASASPGQRQGC